jgi:hypothetical protein
MGDINWKPTYRLVVFVPGAALDEFIKMVSPDIPSFLGPYDHVAWWSEAGTEQFRPLQAADQTSGKTGEITHESSRRVELSLPFDRAALDRFVQEVIVPAHPWEKPVVYVYETSILAP